MDHPRQHSVLAERHRCHKNRMFNEYSMVRTSGAAPQHHLRSLMPGVTDEHKETLGGLLFG